jgi:uncharacterized RDD family membrane protein YckC
VTSGSSAGFGRRAAALIYDALLLAALLVAYTSAAMIFTHGHALLHETVGLWAYLYQAGLIAVIGAYFVINWTRSGQTLGMRAWHLRAVSHSGRPMTYKDALLRFACAILAWGPAALGVLWLYLDPEHLALHDRLSSTRMIHLTRS